MPLSKVVVVGLIGAGGLHGIYHWVSSEKEGVTLRETEEYEKQEWIFGNKFASFFLTTQDGTNTEAWEKKDLQADTAIDSGFFSELKDLGSTRTVKEICKTRYEVNVYLTYLTNEDAKWKEVWKFCSIGESKPQTIEESKNFLEGEEKKYTEISSENKLGRHLKEKVISTENKDNDWFWDIREQDWKNGILLGDENEKFFPSQKTMNIRDVCKGAYNKEKAILNEESTEITETEVIKYCAIEVTT